MTTKIIAACLAAVAAAACTSSVSGTVMAWPWDHLFAGGWGYGGYGGYGGGYEQNGYSQCLYGQQSVSWWDVTSCGNGGYGGIYAQHYPAPPPPSCGYEDCGDQSQGQGGQLYTNNVQGQKTIIVINGPVNQIRTEQAAVGGPSGYGGGGP